MQARKSIINLENNDSRNPQGQGHGFDDILVVKLGRQGRPGFEIEGLKLSVDGFGGALIQQRKRTSHGGHVHRLIEPIEHEYAAVQNRHESSLQLSKRLRRHSIFPQLFQSG